ncbi:ABC transporter permease [Natronorubrum halophilum]|uniref:ABC transporter permease n=1 Tax=Natronorubrum halophilum TaxID=1702106 RepID=UPI0010C1A515|nr:ABC transporter permease [Natronorubrum halophilum]
MFPVFAGFDAVLPIGPVAAVSSIAATPVLDLLELRALALAVGWMALTLVVGGILIAGTPSAARSIRDDTLERPDLAFATGFVVFFGLLVVVAIPLFVTTYVENPAVLALGALVALPAVLLWLVLLIAGGSFGVVAVGDRIAGRLGDESPSLRRALATGTVVLGASQLVPVLGAVVAMGVATLGTGGAVRRWTDVGSGRRDIDASDGQERDPTDAADGLATADRRRSDSSETGITKSKTAAAGEVGTETESATATAGYFDGAGSSGETRADPGSHSAQAADEDEGSIDEWEWALDPDRDDETSRESDGER